MLLQLQSWHPFGCQASCLRRARPYLTPSSSKRQLRQRCLRSSRENPALYNEHQVQQVASQVHAQHHHPYLVISIRSSEASP